MSGELEKIKTLMGDLEEEALLALVKKRLEAGDAPMAVIEACRDGMQIVGDRFAKQEYFVSELVASGELFNEVMEIIGPRMPAGEDSKSQNEIVFGTVRGDIHDIGKNIVTSMLRANGFKVYDMGIDVPPQVFVDKISETKAPVVLLSGFLTLAFDSMKQTVDAIKTAGMRDKVKICIGGGQIDANVQKYTGADGWGPDAMTAVSFSRKWIGG